MILNRATLSPKLPVRNSAPRNLAARVALRLLVSSEIFLSLAPSALTGCNHPTQFDFQVKDTEGQKAFEKKYPLTAHIALDNKWVSDHKLSYNQLAWEDVAKAVYGNEKFGDFLRALNGGVPAPMQVPMGAPREVASALADHYKCPFIAVRVADPAVPVTAPEPVKAPEPKKALHPSPAGSAKRHNGPKVTTVASSNINLGEPADESPSSDQATVPEPAPGE